MWKKVKAGFASFRATAADTFGCNGNNGNAIDDDDDDNFMADGNGKGASSQPSFVEIDLLRSDLNHQRKFPDNSIRTAKYTLVSGLPLSLLYQFYKISNFYFLLVMVITLVPGASPINPFSSVVPLCIVLGAGIIKDLWEDWKRRKADQKANEMTVYVLRVSMPSGESGSRARSGLFPEATASAAAPSDTERSHVSSRVGPLASGDNTKLKHSHHSTVRDTDERDSSNPAMDCTPGDSPGKEPKQARAVRFLFPSEKSRSKSTVHAGDECTSPRRSIEMTSCDRNPQTGAAAQPPAVNAGEASGTGACPSAPAAPSHEPVVTFQAVRSCDVYPGDIMLLLLGEEVKADCLILNTSLPDGLTYIETANLDGETNAKTRRAKIQTVEALGTVEDIVERSLGVPSSNAAAVYARMNGANLDDAGVTAGELSPKASVESCGGVTENSVGTPAPGAADALGLVAGQLPDVETSAKTEEEKRRLLSCATSKAAERHDPPSAESQRRPPQANHVNDRSNWGSIRDDVGSHTLPTTHLEREAHEAGEVANRRVASHIDASYHGRCFSHPTQLQGQQFMGPHPRTARPLFMSSANLAAPSASEPLLILGGTSGDLALERLEHQRHMTLDERLMEDGTIPVPKYLQELSAQYERVVHSRTSSLLAHTQPSARVHHAEVGLMDEAKSGCGEGDSGQCRRSLHSGAVTPATVLMRRSHGLSDEGVMPAEGSSGSNRNHVEDAAHPVNSGTASATQLQQPSSGVVLVCCVPTPDLSAWFGQLRMPSGEMVPLGIDQFIPRGCLIRNTDWVLGAVVYTGRHTKMLLNLRPKPNKITNVTRRLNQLNVFLFLLNQLLMFLLCGLAVWSKHHLLRQLPGSKTAFAAWYIQWNLTQYSDCALFWWRYLTNFVLLSYLIPMSLYVTLEFNKAMQMLMIGADNRMAVYDEFTGAIKKARPKTSELNCQLSHVRYIFTDKTGTLTENLMTYVGGIVDGQTHNETEQPGGIGRALLKHYSGGGSGGGGRGNSSSTRRNASASGVPPLRSSVVSAKAAPTTSGPQSPQTGPVQPHNSGALLPSVQYRHTSSVKDLPNFARPGDSTPAWNFQAGVGSGAGLLPSGSIAHHRRVASESAHLWTSGTFNGFGSYNGAYTSMNATLRAGAGGGLGDTSEVVLERDPLFRYLRALALCHSIVCFPVLEQGSLTSSSEAGESPHRTEEDAKAHSGVESGEDGATVRQRTKETRKPRKTQRRHGDKPARSRHRGGEEGAGDAPETGKSAAKRPRKPKHRETADHAESTAASAHHTAATHSRHSSITGLPPVSGIAANFVEIPYAVPAGPICDDREPFPSTADPAALGGNGDHEPLVVASTSLTTAAPPPWQHPSQPAPPHLADSSVFQAHSTNISKLHGRTSSASWYQNRYLNRVMHSRNFSQNSNTNTHLRPAASGGFSYPLSGMNNRVFRSGMASRTMGSSVSGMVGLGMGGGGDLDQFIDRSKIYEGQSLDEIALVNAARENGFSLFERTAKQMYVKTLGRVLCYDIIAELEFTPQRKLMSILLQRRPDLDTEKAATSAAAGTSSHYHRRSKGSLAADPQASNNNNASVHSHANESCSYPACAVSPAYAAHNPFSLDATVLETSVNDPDGADSRHPATPPAATRNSSASNLRALGQPPLPKPPSQASLVQQSPELSRATLQHVRSSSIFAPPPPPTTELLSQAALGETAVQLSTAGGGSRAAVEPRRYLLLVKGADSSMMEIVNMHKKANARVKEKMLSELDAMAQLGLRTLVLGQRYLHEEEVLAWLPVFNEAQCAMQDRSEKLHQAYALLEKDVDIVGTTAVEDKLQDEVPQTLEFCIQASIVVWMLTGDKRETAVTIAHTSGLVSANYADSVCHLDVSDIVEEETLLKQQKQYEERVRAKKENGEGDESSEEDDDDDVSLSPSQMLGRSPPGGESTNLNAPISIGGNSAPRAQPDLSSTTHSSGPQSAHTMAWVAHGGILHQPQLAGTSEEVSGVKSGSTTASGADGGAERQSAEAFLERKVARIEAQLAAAEAKCSENAEVFDAHTVVVVVDGKTLDFIFSDNARAHRFFMLGSRCRSAVCCRMTPLQKAKIVRMFKRNMNAVALAIGDGANDVSMIQESSIGVGIMGLEGSQAELASDYAIPKFRFLKRLLFVHGRFSLFRDAHCIVFSLYKNVIVTVGMIAYQFYACYSGQALMDSWLLAMFSIFFCSLQPLMIGILDKDVEDELAESLPTLYPPLSREFMYFSFSYIAKWLIDGVVEGFLFFFILMYGVGMFDNLYPYMSPALEDYGMTFFTMLVLVVDLRVVTLVTYYMILFVLVVVLEILFLPSIELIYSAMHNFAGSNWCVKVANELYGTSGKFWLMLFFACGVLVVITMTSNMYIQLFYPWQNAGFAMRAARQSSHRVPYKHMKKELKEEYAQLLARYEVLRRQQEALERREQRAEKPATDGAASPPGRDAARPPT
ncbi:putative Phospholipid transporting ATPase-like protein [Leptomonas seymouri]|uniref:Putative Phospholipid transporting ATPase-like protein n=1 Tax=Leptomonas seymouri TaxID=5684 RepID=A0A0N0P764_LEPSE|nr:putative Phospholipid transporting ATPase-like protein [Leptomonas seymouri]|eukprot:KPI88429.1 putative Phospholipid transporting ATPase-like protein [Leptomonas seymouri]